MRAFTATGQELDANFSITRVGPNTGRLTLDSANGVGRNKDYIETLGLLLQRLESVGAELADAVLASRSGPAKSLSPLERRLVIEGTPFPIRLAAVAEMERLGRGLRRAAAALAREPGSRGPGNLTKRIELIFEIPEMSGWCDSRVRALLQRGDVVEEAEEIVAIVRPRRKRPHGGQGFGLTPTQRSAVEARAMSLAERHYRSSWATVTDVSAHESFDLRCTDGARELHVEVKGTTGLGESVLLTRNEIRHAREIFPRIALFVVSSIVLGTDSVGVPAADGGTIRILEPWDIDACTVELMTAQCLLPASG